MYLNCNSMYLAGRNSQRPGLDNRFSLELLMLRMGHFDYNKSSKTDKYNAVECSYTGTSNIVK